MSTMEHSLRSRFFLGLLGGVAILTLYIMSSYILTLLIAAAFATIFHPIFVRLRRKLKFRWLASSLTVLIAGIIVLVPLMWIVTQISISASELYGAFARGDISLKFFEPAEQYLSSTFPDLNLNLQTPITQMLQWIARNAASLLSGTVNTAIRFFIGIFALYIFIRDGESFISWIIRTSPLPPKDTSALLSRMHATVLSIIQGNLFVCVVQGILTGLAMTFFGVPNPALWGALTVIVAIAPGIGPSVVILPAGFYLFSLGNTVPAVAFVLIAMGTVWFMANIVGPVLVSQGVKIHELWIVISVIGGIVTLGPLGFIVGPLCVSVLSALIDMTPHVLRQRTI